MRNSLLLATLSIVVLGCGPSNKTPVSNIPGGDAGNPQISSPYSYQFTSRRYDGTSCTTGLHQFQNQKQLCLSLQDPVQNQDCALDERINKLLNECPGYEMFESTECKVAVVSRSASIDMSGNYPAGAELRSQKYCVGHNLNSIDQNGIATAGPFYDNLSLNVNMSFEPRYSSGYGYVRSSVTNLDVELHETNPYYGQHSWSNKMRVKRDDFNGLTVQTGGTPDGRYQYVISCHGTWACDAN